MNMDVRQNKPEALPASELLNILNSGRSIKLNGHSLEWDRDFAILAGTNAYGVDYYWGPLDLPTVDAWRKRMLSGMTIGDCPPGCD